MFKINPLSPPEDFVEWIKSVNKGIDFIIPYKPFDDYVVQALEWKSENVNTDIDDRVERLKVIGGEKKRFKENSLYYLERYNYYKEAKAPDGSGKLKTTTSISQRILCFILDIGMSSYIAKARGIRASSTFLPVLGMKARCYQNLHVKFVCSDGDKVEGLFEDKLKFAYNNDPIFFRVNLGSDRKDGLEFYYRKPKNEGGGTGGLNSKIIIHAPSKDVLNALNPDIAVVDEAASIPFFSKMMKQARPTMFTSDPITEERTMTKQIIAWGSSQPDDGKTQNISGEFLDEWKKVEENWNSGNFSEGIIPLFFNWSYVPGMNQDFYDKEKQLAESTKKDIDIKAFRNNFPSCVEDILLKSVDTLIPYEQIADYHDRINLFIKQNKLVLERGYFIPIYDKNSALPPECGSPYRIIGTEWYPTPDGSTQATTTIYIRPDYDWIDRYYQGDDPIESQSGKSNFSSAIWDNEYKTISAIMACRPANYHFAYEQAYCMHLFYSNPNKDKFIPELVEINIGQGYLTYCEIMKYGYNMVAKCELPLGLQTGDHFTGISKRSNNAKGILDATHDLMNIWGSNIYIDQFWVEAKTYVEHNNKQGYGTRFAPADIKHNRDDRLDSSTYAYINALCHDNVKPKNISQDAIIRTKKRILKFVNGHNSWVEV